MTPAPPRRSHVLRLLATLALVAACTSSEGGPPSVPGFTSTSAALAPSPANGRLVLGERAKVDPDAVAAFLAAVEKRGTGRWILVLDVPLASDPDAAPPTKLADTNGRRAAIADTRKALESRLRGADVTFLEPYEFLPLAHVEAGTEGLRAILDTPGVRAIEEDTASPPLLDSSTRVINAAGAWTQGFTGTGRYVAVLDTGADTTHPWFAGKPLSEACYSSSVLFSSISLCPGGVSSSTAVGAGQSCPAAVRGCDHGTHVSGISVGKGPTTTGVAPDAGLIAIQVFSRFDSNASCANAPPCALTYQSDWLRGLERVYALSFTLSIASVNMSLGSGRYLATCDADSPSGKLAIDNLAARGVATLIAAGNDGYTDAIGFPACISTAVVVGSTDDDDTVSSFSNHNALVDVMAPGNDITAPVPGGTLASKNGTSMATPHVAGAWAVLKGKSPNSSTAEILAALRSTGTTVTGSTNGITTPRIDLGRAIDAIGVAAPRFSPPPGTYDAPINVTLTSTTAAATIRFTTDGSTPSATRGTVLANGGTVAVSTGADLRAIAYTGTAADSGVTRGTYTILGRVRVGLEPAAARDTGARWRFAAPFLEGFETGSTSRLPWVLSGAGNWAASGTDADTGTWSFRSPDLADGQSADAALTFESDGGDLSFRHAESTERTYDLLLLYVDGIERGRWSGENAWATATVPIPAGTHTIVFRFRKDGSLSVGADAVVIDGLSLPGDAWRLADSTVSLPAPGTATVRFLALADWFTPTDAAVTATAGSRVDVTATYVQRVAERPVFSLSPGTWPGPVGVTVTAPTAGSTLRVTTDGSAPSGTNGTSIASGTTLNLATTTTLRAIALRTNWLPSPERVGTYRIAGALDVTLAPAEAVAAGARWRLSMFDDGFEGGDFTRAPYAFAGPAGWSVVADPSGASRSVARSPASLGDSQTASISLDVDTSAGTLAFSFLTSTELNFDVLSFHLDGTELGRWSGETPWSRASLPVTAGPHNLRWTYTKDPSDIAGDDRVLLDDLSIPGDAWRTPGSLALVTAGTPQLLFQPLPDWEPPANTPVTVVAATTSTATGTYVRRRTAPVTFSPAPGLFRSPVTLTLACASPGSTIRFTTDGSTPDATSPTYAGPLTIPGDTTRTIRAFAQRAGWLDGALTEGTFRVTGTVAAPVFDPPAGLSTAPVTVNATSATPGATIRFTTDGTAPTAASPVWAGPLTVGPDTRTTLRAIAVRADWNDSAEATATWVVTGTVATPVLSPEPGTFPDPVTLTATTTTSGAILRYTLDGTDPTEASPVLTSALTLGLDLTHVVKVRGYRTNWLDSGIATATYLVTGTVAAPTFSPPPGLSTTALDVTVATATPGATLRCTLDGSAPTDTTPECPATIPLGLDATHQLRARAFRPDWRASPTSDGTWRITGTSPTPTATPAPGNFRSAQRVALAVDAPGTVIRYTLDGTAPTATSAAFSTPLTLGLDSTTRVRARAFRTDWTPSPELDATWLITGRVATPFPSSLPAIYDRPRELTLRTATPGATLRVTFDGSDPRESGIVLEGPIPLPIGTDALIRAYARRDGWDDSALFEGTYAVFAPLAWQALDGSPLGPLQLVPSTPVTLRATGGSGRYEVGALANRGGVPPSIDGTSDTFVVTVPARAGFAGRYQLELQDPRTNLKLQTPIDVAPMLASDRDVLLAGADTATLTFTGALPGDTVRWTLDAPSIATIEPDSRVLLDAPNLHPAVAHLAPAPVDTPTELTVMANAGALLPVQRTFTLVPAERLRLHVVDAAGAPIQQAHVVSPTTTEGLPLSSGDTDADGRVSLDVARSADAHLAVVTHVGFFGDERQDSACESDEGCVVELRGEPRTLSGTVSGLFAGESARLLASFTHADGSRRHVTLDPVVGQGSGTDGFSASLDRWPPWDRLDAAAPGYVNTAIASADALSLRSGDRAGLNLVFEPTTPIVSEPTVTALADATWRVQATVDPLQRTTTVTLHVEPAPPTAPETRTLNADDGTTTTDWTLAELACGTTYALALDATNDHARTAQAELSPITTAACPPPPPPPPPADKGCGCDAAAPSLLLLAGLFTRLRRRRT